MTAVAYLFAFLKRYILGAAFVTRNLAYLDVSGLPIFLFCFNNRSFDRIQKCQNFIKNLISEINKKGSFVRSYIIFFQWGLKDGRGVMISLLIFIVSYPEYIM